MTHKTYIGCDISKSKFDIAITDENYKVIHKATYLQSKQGFDDFILWLQQQDSPFVVMEATGNYHRKLITALHEAGIDFNVVNPKLVKAFAKTNSFRIKTDQLDAKILALYAKRNIMKCYVMPSTAQQAIQHLNSRLEAFKKQRVMLKNMQHSDEYLPHPNQECADQTAQMLEQVNRSIKSLEKEIAQVMEDQFSSEVALLSSIPGVGKGVIRAFLMVFGNLSSFESSKQAVAFVGLDPRSYQSGSSLCYQGGISKVGNKVLRRVLYMAALQASRRNKQCQALYERIVAAGKKKKVALVAVAHKLLSQACGVLFSKTQYQTDYTRNLKTT